ncbi:MAG: bifunctional riboflavin kinase/FAD synthetase [Bacteroidota bacterium]|nr:bifunctional riboflavin kinase/FAD synthetase [Bacteroidota bacterium]MDP4192534.1 bifunctional riboflavin kinase/FAD synthetase [Bacteroidota bacterium]MDP4194118.1 bifunctional riboflavin kinase/FAD synthetase [Bacteroidota bacterium]
MNIFYDINEVNKEESTVLTIGTFDGFHKGHQQIVDHLVIEAKKSNARSFLITFEPHPRSVLSKDFDLKLLTTLQEKLDLIEKSGVDNVLVINFTPEFSRMTSDEFIQQIIVDKIGIKELVIGYDHRIGRDRGGDENKLRELGDTFGFMVTPVYAVKVDQDAISSTKIRHALVDGDIERTNKYLGRNYSFSGSVVKGAMRGRTLGFPTVNIAVNNKHKMIPARGVYLVKLFLNSESFYGIMNIGMRPTFGDTVELVIEVYIFNFNRDVYGENLTVEVIKKLREEKKFDSKDALVEQLETDKKKALEIVNYLNN